MVFDRFGTRTNGGRIQHGKVAVQLGLVAHGGQLGVIVVVEALDGRHGVVLWS